ncbi:hypothetical protein MJI69_28565, partial [Salmonella enterica subsp. enterica serovar Anatum]|nr:hypothetical protein [Salmonella enterica subsp. enterica serovar Anatum]
ILSTQLLEKIAQSGLSHNEVFLVNTGDHWLLCLFYKLAEKINHLSQLLSGYLNDKQIALINKNMVREFSLHNVVNSLTILNANK